MEYRPYNHDKKKNNQNKSGGDLSKFGKTVILGVALYAVGYMGFGNIRDSLLDAKDKVEKVQEIVEYTQSDSANSSYSSKQNVKNEIDISPEDVNDILEYLSELVDGENPVGEDVIIIDYSSLDSSKKYKSNIINKLDDFDKTVTFIMVNTGSLTKEEADEEMARIKELVSTNIDMLHDTSYGRVSTAGTLNRPSHGNFVASITYTKR